MYISAQICALISILINFYVSVKKLSRRGILGLNIIINLLNTAHYLLIGFYELQAPSDASSGGGFSGAACSLIFTLMLVAFFFKGKNRFLSSIALPITFGVAFVVFGFATYQSLVSLIPIIGHLLLVIAFWMDEEIIIKEFLIAVAFLWALYNGLLGSVVNLVGQSISFILYTAYVIKYYINKKKRTEGSLK